MLTNLEILEKNVLKVVSYSYGTLQASEKPEIVQKTSLIGRGDFKTSFLTKKRTKNWQIRSKLRETKAETGEKRVDI